MDDGFASFLHNPYQFKYLSNAGQAATMSFLRKERFIEGYNWTSELDEIILAEFPSIDVLHRDGLATHFNSLKQCVILSKKKIGLFLLGADGSRPDRHFYRYQRQDGSVTALTRHSICKNLLKSFTDSDIDKFCRETPNFRLYYKPSRK